MQWWVLETRAQWLSLGLMAIEPMCMWLTSSSMCRNDASCGLMRSMSPPHERSGLGASTEMFGEELLRGSVELQPVFGLGEAVALVGKQHVLVVDALVLHGRHDLLGLGLFDPGVVGSLGDQHRDA